MLRNYIRIFLYNINMKTKQKLIEKLNKPLKEPFDFPKSDPSDEPLSARGLSPIILQENLPHKCSGGNTILQSTTFVAKKFDKKITNYNEDFFNQNKNLETFKRRDYCFTLFEKQNITNHSAKFIKDVKYAILGNETCPDTGRFHFQSYIYFHQPKRFNEVKKFFFEEYGAYPHFEACKGNTQQNVNYCSKEKCDEDIYIYGEQPEQGKRVDLNEIKDKILNGKLTTTNILEETPFIYHQYSRTLLALENLKNSRTYRLGEMTTCDWYYGKTGLGKSHKAFENFNNEDYYEYEPDDNGYWENYNGQHTVIINEFRGDITYRKLLKLIDKWPCKVKRRNLPPRPFISKHIIITSSMHPKNVFNNLSRDDNLNQLYRRIKIFQVKNKRIIDKTIIVEDESDNDFSDIDFLDSEDEKTANFID